MRGSTGVGMYGSELLLRERVGTEGLGVRQPASVGWVHRSRTLHVLCTVFI